MVSEVLLIMDTDDIVTAGFCGWFECFGKTGFFIWWRVEGAYEGMGGW